MRHARPEILIKKFGNDQLPTKLGRMSTSATWQVRASGLARDLARELSREVQTTVGRRRSSSAGAAHLPVRRSADGASRSPTAATSPADRGVGAAAAAATPGSRSGALPSPPTAAAAGRGGASLTDAQRRAWVVDRWWMQNELEA